MPGRSENSSQYRYGFNNMEKDDEISGNGNSYDFGDRIYDPRVGRWLSSDPFESKFPSQSPYSFANNSPISTIDVNGDSSVVVISGLSNSTYKSSTGEIFVVYELKVYENMTAAQYEVHSSNGTLPEASYTTQIARDANDIVSKGEIVNHSSKRYGTNNEAPPGKYYLFKSGTNGDAGGGSYLLYFGDINGERIVNGPDGIRTGLAFHQYDPRDSQGCLTFCSGTDTQPVFDLISAIPDLEIDSETVELIIEERNVDKSNYSNEENGTKYKGYSQSKPDIPSVSGEIEGSPSQGKVFRSKTN
jgi:RHS repeat-associated protein